LLKSSSDEITGSARRDFLLGGAGADTFFGSGGGDVINGGADTDTVYYSAPATAYDVTRAVNGSPVYTVTNKATGAKDYLVSIENLTLGSGKDTIRLGSSAFDSLKTLDTGAGDDRVDSSVLNLKITLGDGDDTVLHAGRGSVVSGGEGRNTFAISDDVLIVDAKPTDVIVNYAGFAIHGAIGRLGQESPWVVSLKDSVAYGVNMLGDLVIREFSDGAQTFISNYQGGSDKPFDQQTGGILVGLAQITAYRLLDPDKPSVDDVALTFKLGNQLMYTLTGKTFFNVGYDPLVLDLNGDGIRLTPVSEVAPMFDVKGTNFAVHTGWVGSDDGLLVRDLNGNGQIDNARELFGGPDGPAFAVLAAADSNQDDVIDADNAICGPENPARFRSPWSRLQMH